MVAIAPFRALRYNLRVVGDLGRVVAPPYDVISAQEQEQLYHASPYNIIRLIYGKPLPDDTPTANRYTRARQAFDEWRKAQVLTRDETPAIYLYAHTFHWQGESRRRLGFVALLQFAGSVPEQVLRHEATFEGPKADRARLLDAVQANLSPIFCIVPDSTKRLQQRLAQWSQAHEPLASARLPGRDESVRIWAIQDPETMTAIQQGVAPAGVLIADGHHRFEVALARRERFGAVLTYFSWLEDPAVQVRPIHRVLCAPPTSPQWRATLQALCQLEPASSLNEVTEWLAAGDDPGRFGYYEAGRYSRLTLRPDVLAEWLLHPSVPLPLAPLDVMLLHQLVMPKIVGAMPAGGRGPEHASGSNQLMRYTPDPLQAVAMVDQRQGDCAWLLRAMPLPQVFALASQGLTLPQKTTYFYPKLLSGLFINCWDEEA